jgi:uncharacterized protein YcgI (DUF1989 family)
MNSSQQIIHEASIPRNTGWAHTLSKGQVIRIIGSTIVDFVAFNQDDLTERFDQARTKVYNRKIFITTGDVLMSKSNRPMLTIIEDTYREGTHDLQHGMCSRARWERAAQEGRLAEYYFRHIPPEELPGHGCWENLIEALKPWNIPPYDIPSPFNLFQTVIIDPKTGLMVNSTTRPKPGTYIDLRAEIDCLVAMSSCPDLWAGGKQGIQVQIYEAVTDSKEVM